MPTSINSLSIPSLCLKIIKDICFAGVGSWDESDPDEKTLKELRANFNKQSVHPKSVSKDYQRYMFCRYRVVG